MAGSDGTRGHSGPWGRLGEVHFHRVHLQLSAAVRLFHLTVDYRSSVPDWDCHVQNIGVENSGKIILPGSYLRLIVNLITSYGASRDGSALCFIHMSQSTYNMVAPRWKTPPLSFLADVTRKFHKELHEIGDADSIIREYTSSTEGVFYLAAGKNCVGHVVLPNRLSSFQELVTEFFAQVKDPALAQLVWGHGRVRRTILCFVPESQGHLRQESPNTTEFRALETFRKAQGPHQKPEVKTLPWHYTDVELGTRWPIAQLDR
ncbi:hypothetical protein B0H14DRAFT_2633227 [Mycena olivaceomarginata]|nr:hypothetical protein B0H14DRAFT_2633227 [Mycena olivaceomarginata]